MDKPEAFLSAEAIDRRERMGIAIEADDWPIAPAILDQLARTGVKPILTSKWMQTVVVESEDYGVEQTLRQLPTVDSVRFVWQGEPTTPLDRAESRERLTPTKEPKKCMGGSLRKSKRQRAKGLAVRTPTRHSIPLCGQPAA